MNRHEHKQKKQQERQYKAQLARITKSESQENVLKWIERAMYINKERKTVRRNMSWGYISECMGKPALVASDGNRLHISWVGIDGLPEWVPFKKSLPRQDSDRFPDYQAIIPRMSLMQTVTLKVAEFTAAVKRAQVFARDSAQYVKFEGNPQNHTLKISALSRVTGDIAIYLDMHGGYTPFTIYLNAQYVLDALKIWEKHECVDFEVWDGNTRGEPVIIGQRGYKMALLMPMSGTY